MERLSWLYPTVWFQSHRRAASVVELTADFCLYLRRILAWILAWFLNLCVWIILRWWFKVRHITARADTFGFGVAKGVKLRWQGIPDIDVENLALKIEWDVWKLSIPSLTFHVRKLRSELLSNLKDARADTYFSFTLKWTLQGPHIQSPHRMLPALKNVDGFHGREVKVLACLRATEVEIATELFQCQTMAVMSVVLSKLDSLDFLLVKSCRGATLQIRVLDSSYLCSGFDPAYYQARQSEVGGVPCIDVAMAWPRLGPTTVHVNCEKAQVSLSPKNIDNLLGTLSHLLDMETKKEEQKMSDTAAAETENGKPHVNITQTVVKIHGVTLILKDLDGCESCQVGISFELSLDDWQKKTSYVGCIRVEAFCHPRGKVSRDPCAILGDETISRPWTCSFNGSSVKGQYTVVSVMSQSCLSLVLRPACIQAFSDIHKDFQSLVDQAQIQTLLMSLKRRANVPKSQTQVFVEIYGIDVYLEMDVYEQLIRLSLDKIKLQLEKDADQMSFELALKDMEIEDNVHGVKALQFVQHSEKHFEQALKFLAVKNLKRKEDISFKHLQVTLGNVTVCLEEPILLKLLQFAGVKRREQLWGEDDPRKSNDEEKRQVSLTTTTTPFFFDKVEATSFVSVATVSPAKELPDDLQELKEALEIPQGLPPTVDKMRVEFASFLRTGIRYKSLQALVRDVRIHYLKEIGRQSGKVLGSLHILGNVSALKRDIAEGLAELQETGDYVEFVGHIRSGLTDSYYKLTDSWSAAITRKTPTMSSPKDSEDSGSRDASMLRKESLVQSIAGNLASGIGSWIFRSSPEDTRQAKPQASSTPTRRSSSTVPARSPSVIHRRLIAETGEQESSGSEDSYFSWPVPLEDSDSVSSSPARRTKGQEFLRRLKLSLGDSTSNETFEYCLRLRHLKPDEKLNVLVTSHALYFLKGKTPDGDNVVLTVKFSRLHNARYKAEGDVHYLELTMRWSGARRLSLPSPNPADSPLVRCDTADLAKKAARKINEIAKTYERTIDT